MDISAYGWAQGWMIGVRGFQEQRKRGTEFISLCPCKAEEVGQ